MNKNSVVITGLGCICAAGGTLGSIMPNIYGGKRSLSLPTIFTTNLDKVSPVFEVPDSFINNSEELPNNLSRTTFFMVTALKEALNHAKLDLSLLNRFRVGVVIGTTVGCTLNNESFYRSYKENEYPSLKAVTKYLNNNPALSIARLYSCNGPATTVVNACSSGTDAIGIAKSWIENDICDLVIAGGADELCRTTYLGFTSLLITSTEPCRPFDKNRKGLNLGEGAGALIMESEISARQRGVRALAKPAGYATYADAYHPTAPHPEGTGLRKAISMSLKKAGLESSDIDFINAHGTSTPDNDKVEGTVIHDLFPGSIPVASTKAYTGHTLGAAGAIEAVFTVQSMIDKRLPATAGFEEPDDKCRIIPTTATTDVKGNAALSTSLAFGGNNSAVVFQAVN